MELKPCPFCGGKAYQVQIGNAYTKKRGFDVGCQPCRVKISDRVIRQSLEWCMEVNIKNWNTRAPDPEARKQGRLEGVKVGIEAAHDAMGRVAHIPNAFGQIADPQNLVIARQVGFYMREAVHNINPAALVEELEGK